MLKEIAENPADSETSQKYYKYIHGREYEFSKRGAFYSAPALIGILKHTSQLLSEPAACMSMLFALAAFAFQGQIEVERTFGKKFNAAKAFNEESKTYKDRVRFSRSFLKKMFAGEEGPLYQAFAVMALNQYPQDLQIDRDERSPAEFNRYLSFLNEVITATVSEKQLVEMEEKISKFKFRNSCRVQTLLSLIRPDERELIFYNRVDLARATAKIINKVSGAELAVPYTSEEGEEESEANLRKIMDPKGTAKKLVMTSKAGEGKNIPKASRLYVCSVPNTPTELIQLYGRVGRNGEVGEVVLLLTAQEHRTISRLEREAAQILPAFCRVAESQG